jgi:hypothetical protein
MHVCHNIFIVILLLPLIDRTCYRVFIGYYCSDRLFSVIEASSFKRAQLSRCLLPPHLRTETDTVPETLCSSFF